jgi:hypothetical protein
MPPRSPRAVWRCASSGTVARSGCARPGPGGRVPGRHRAGRHCGTGSHRHHDPPGVRALGILSHAGTPADVDCSLGCRCGLRLRSRSVSTSGCTSLTGTGGCRTLDGLKSHPRLISGWSGMPSGHYLGIHRSERRRHLISDGRCCLASSPRLSTTGGRDRQGGHRVGPPPPHRGVRANAVRMPVARNPSKHGECRLGGREFRAVLVGGALLWPPQVRTSAAAIAR